jgi:hypothetical protein
MNKTKKRSAASRGARAMARARWAHVPPEERSRLMRAAGLKGGRPREEKRCFCGLHTWTRAMSRNFDCCRKAGVLKEA